MNDTLSEDGLNIKKKAKRENNIRNKLFITINLS